MLSTAFVEQMDEWRLKWQAEKMKADKLTASLLHSEKQWKRDAEDIKIKFEEEIVNLKRQNNELVNKVIINAENNKKI